MSEEKEAKLLSWIKGGKGILAIIFILTVIPGLIISIVEESEKKRALQIEASELCLDYYLNENTGIISLYLLNRSQTAAHGLNLTIYIPRVEQERYFKEAFTVMGTGDCELSKKNDSPLVANFSHTTIYPTFSNKRAYPVVDFKFNGVTVKKLKETEQSIKYIINCDEGEFKGKIPVFYIFTIK
jgi:hypothetical protein